MPGWACRAIVTGCRPDVFTTPPLTTSYRRTGHLMPRTLLVSVCNIWTPASSRKSLRAATLPPAQWIVQGGIDGLWLRSLELSDHANCEPCTRREVPRRSA
jgi:hypothetical protein